MSEMENISYVPVKQPIVFTLEGFIITRQQGYPLFAVTLIVYAVMLLGNLIVVTVIATNAKLHKPMTIGYVAAIIQAFCVHTYSSAGFTIISAMAYDRYVAICKPLHYHTIMTTGRLVSLCFLAWFIAISLVLTLLSLNVITPLCGTFIKHTHCSNPVILRLACIPTPISNIYGLCMTWFLSTGSFLVITFTYVKILIACVVKQEKNSRSKAIQTCASHLAVYVLFQISGLIIVVTYRFPEVSHNTQKFCAILFFIVPPTVNPIIYGISMKDIRTNIIKIFKYTVLPK
ncbi:hypothetical protein SKAU_G00326490 [Synaphobranchus kaupii]|uniref:G-protein coupled receptors family 1 profile domain-containing protein n=1 Tax=Synaphobranchus kaupii TaxID=118154 RepID=A0A9Q1IKA6_SYNKA|nr:hypothetical protein SKAU_G00326490 [Synaphobranchus kaupii]